MVWANGGAPAGQICPSNTNTFRINSKIRASFLYFFMVFFGLIILY